MVVKHMDILINDYINGERSLCRDEAQFSAYLFQILNGCKRVKIDSDNFTNKTYEVMQAYYMPAFLRDYFNYADSKAEFNRKLVTFANRKLRALYAGEEAQGAMLEDVDAKAVNAAEIYNLDKELDIENPGRYPHRGPTSRLLPQSSRSRGAACHKACPSRRKRAARRLPFPSYLYIVLLSYSIPPC